MKPAQIKALRSRLTGTVTNAADACRHYATDSGVVTVEPAAVIHAATGADVRAAVGFAAEQAGNKSITLTPRGNGTGQSGGALGEGAVVMLSGLRNLVRLGKDSVTVEAGMPVATLLLILQTHKRTVLGLSLRDGGTVGGAVAGGAARVLANQIERLRVVLDDGSELLTGPVNRRELNRKKGFMGREGDLYRGIDGLLQDHQLQIKEAAASRPGSLMAGYQIGRVARGGSIDLGQLMVGSEGTLGIITEITFKTAPLADRTTVVAGTFENLEAAGEAIHRLARLDPGRLQIVNDAVLAQVQADYPERFNQLFGGAGTVPAALVWAEFNEPSHWQQNRHRRHASRIIGKHGSVLRLAEEPTGRPLIQNLTAAAVAALRSQPGGKKPLPLLNGAYVPADQLITLVQQTAKLLRKHQLGELIWAEAGTGTLYAAPSLDPSKPKSRKTALKVVDEFAGIVTALGGSVAPGNEGYVAAPYLERQVGRELFDLFKQVKQICDPHSVFSTNPKLGVKKKDLEGLLRHEYIPADYDALSNL